MQLTIDNTPLSQPDLGQIFAKGKPFPVLTLDNFIPLPLANGLLEEIAAYSDFRKSNDYIFAKNKFESPLIENLGPNGKVMKEFFLSSEFASAISTIYGRKIFVDPNFVGGGLHRGGKGSYLDMHADFNLHPRNRSWIRELNILLYLNKDWRPDHGGCLELRDSNTGKTASIEPRFNRLVLMLTKDFTFHGYKTINFPENTFRTSIAAYAYSEASSAENLAALRTTTTWAPQGGGRLKSLLAHITPQIVTIKQRLFGSATSRKR